MAAGSRRARRRLCGTESGGAYLSPALTSWRGGLCPAEPALALGVRAAEKKRALCSAGIARAEGDGALARRQELGHGEEILNDAVPHLLEPNQSKSKPINREATFKICEGRLPTQN